MEEHKTDRKFLIVACFTLFFTFVGFFFYLKPSRYVGYAPEQPIPFSHKKHAGIRKIQCKYCHSSIERSPHANVPSVQVCMNCHEYVKTDSPHIKKLKKAYDTGTPVQWVNVHVLPDFVYFNHEPHISAGISCEKCHGNIQNMTVVRQINSLTMGWCISCHREQKPPVSTDCSTCHR